MGITGSLTDFSLPEVFQFLEQGQKTGLLKLRETPSAANPQPSIEYIWFHQGRIVAAADRNDQRGLLTLLEQRGWVTERAAAKVFAMHSTPTPLGLCLKSQGLLQPEQLKLLFYGQVIRQVCSLFRFTAGHFAFDAQANLPMAEMTGLSQSAVEVTLTALRSLKDWSALAEKLPLPDSALISITSGKPNLKLDAKEWQIWEFVNGNLPLTSIASQVRLSLEEVRRIAFRLIVVNLAEEIPVPLLPLEPPETLHFSATKAEEVMGEPEKSNVSHSFLQSLMGFLRTKA